MSEIARISTGVAAVIAHSGSAKFTAALFRFLRDWVAVDEACMLVYPDDDRAPIIAHRETTDAGGRPNLDTFISGPFLLDPYYIAAQERRFGFFPLMELAPAGFRNSEYYRTYYRFSGLFDESGYLVRVGNRGFVNLSLARTSPRRLFERDDLARLQMLTALVTALIQQHYELVPDLWVQDGVEFRSRLQAAMADFGRSVLTPRERQIIHSILHGHASKAIASHLDISVETVKLHRKNAYRKLTVRNQSELFHAFIRALQD